jgi:signal transduction histidine kinase
MSSIHEEVLRSIARFAGASWAACSRGSERLEFREGGSPRDIDAGLLRSLERGRLVRIGRERLRRWPRAVSSDLREALAYVHPERPADRVVLGLGKPGGIEAAPLEPILACLLEHEPSSGPPESVDAKLRNGCVAHDLRHLLTLASLEVERARTDPARGLDRLQTALEDARKLCESALAGARAAHRRVRPVLEAAARAASLASGRAERVTVAIGGGADPELAVDAELLGRAVRNLVLNAIEATPDGGRVSVDLDDDAAGEFRIAVRDQGRGIAAEDLPDLLRPGRTASGGSGFGTASVRVCVRELGGRLDVRSRPRQGTEFVLRLPRGA